MQLLPALTRDPKVIAREKSVGDHLPYAAQINDHTLQTYDGLLLQTLHLRGLLFETADSDELNYRKQLRDAMLQALGSPQFALYHHVIRRRVDLALDAQFPDAFSQTVNAQWRQKLGRKQLYVNELYLTLIRRPLKGGLGLADQLRGWVGRSKSEADVAQKAALAEGDVSLGGAGNDVYLVRRGDGEDVAEDRAEDAPLANPGLAGDYVQQRYAAIAAGTVARNWKGNASGAVQQAIKGGDDAVVFGAGIGIGDIQLMRSAWAANDNGLVALAA